MLGPLALVMVNHVSFGAGFAGTVIRDSLSGLTSRYEQSILLLYDLLGTNNRCDYALRCRSL